MTFPSTPLRKTVFWPLRLRRALDGIATALMQAFMLARERALRSPSPAVRTLAGQDAQTWETELRAREIAVFQRRLESMPPFRRPQVPPADRFEILQIMRLRGLSVEKVAGFFVLHPNTIREWLRRFQTRRDIGRFFGSAPFNKLGDAARWVVHEVRRLCPEREFGTRSIAMAIVRAGIQISRSAVQRILREKKPRCPAAPAAATVESFHDAVLPHGILRPKKPNRTWHLDLATLDFLFIRFYVAAVVDGFSRKLLALRVYRDAPATLNMLALVRRCVGEFGAPRFLVTDHGVQFRSHFKRGLRGLGIALVRGRRKSPTFNGRVERFFKTFRLWQRLTLFAWKIAWIQKKLDVFRGWYNAERPMFILSGRTPEEVWTAKSPPEAAAFRASDPHQPVFRVARRRYRGDPRLPVLDIQITRRLAA